MEGLQDEHANADGKGAVAGADHDQDEVDDVEEALGDVDSQEEGRAESAAGALDDAYDVEDQAEQNDGHHNTRDGQEDVVAETGVVLGAQTLGVFLEHAQSGYDDPIQDHVGEHDEDADDPKRDQHALEEGRRVAYDVGGRHDGGVDVLCRFVGLRCVVPQVVHNRESKGRRSTDPPDSRVVESN